MSQAAVASECGSHQAIDKPPRPATGGHHESAFLFRLAGHDQEMILALGTIDCVGRQTSDPNHDLTARSCIGLGSPGFLRGSIIGPRPR